MFVLVATMLSAPFVYLRLQSNDNTILASILMLVQHFFLSK